MKIAARWIVAGCALALLLVGREQIDHTTSTPTPPPIRRFVVITPTPRRGGPGTLLTAVPKMYVVQPGDTLSLIALRFQVTEDALQRANHLDDPDSLYAGQRLLIPESAEN